MELPSFLLYALLALLALVALGVALLLVELSKPPPAGGTPYALPNGMRIQHWQASETDFLFTEIWGAENAYGAASAEGGGSPLVFRPGALILDAGANIGMFSLFAAAQCGGHARVVSFEPIPRTFSVLAANAKAAVAGEFDAVLRGGGGGGGPLVMEPQNVGLSSAPLDTHFEHHPHFTVWSTQDPVFAEARLTRITEDMPRALGSSDSACMRVCFPRWLARTLAGVLLRRKLGVTERVPVKLVTLSSVIDRLNLGPEIDFLKVDVEGAEVEVLKGIREEHWGRIQQVALEVEDFAAKDTVVGMLRERGFATHWFASERKRNPDVHSEVRGGAARAPGALSRGSLICTHTHTHTHTTHAHTRVPHRAQVSMVYGTRPAYMKKHGGSQGKGAGEKKKEK